jgi:hypothetical protein
MKTIESVATICAAVMAATFALFACSSSTTTYGGAPDGGASSGDSAASSPCGPGGVYGTFQISGTLGGTESICGLSLGSFDGGTLTIVQGSSSGANVTVAGSGAGHIDVSSCAATVTDCMVSAASCMGSTDMGATVSLDLSVAAGGLSGTSQLAFNGCQAPGLSFTGTR